MKLVIKGGRVIDPAGGVDDEADVLIEDGVISAVGSPGDMPADADETIDAAGCLVTPGLIDLHVHLREPGEEYKEDIASGSAAAAFGGFTTVVAMPNTDPVIDNAELVAYVRERSEDVGLCRVLPTGAITAGQRGERLAPHGEMKRAGAVGLTDDGNCVQDARLMRAALEYSRDFDLPVLSHAECNRLSHGGHMHEGATATRLGIPGIPSVAEDTMVARDIMLAEYTGGWLHVCHVSTAASVELVRAAQARGVRVTGEAAPHHFTLTDEAVVGFDTNAKMYPPLREETDRAAIIAGLKDGTLSAVATDHAPHSSIEKDTSFADAARGILGLQTALPLTLDLWRSGDLTLEQAITHLTSGAAAALRLPYGTLARGATADVTVIDPDGKWVLSPDDILSKSINSPFIDRSLTGYAVATVLAGKVVYRRAEAS